MRTTKIIPLLGILIAVALMTAQINNTGSGGGLPTGLTYAGSTLTVSTAGSGSAIVALSGNTSGTCTFTDNATSTTVTYSCASAQPAGSSATAAMTFGTSVTGFYQPTSFAANSIAIGGSNVDGLVISNNGGVYTNSSSPIGWSSSSTNLNQAQAGKDTAFSRSAAGVVACGNGTLSDESCLVRSANACRVTSVVNLTTAGGAQNICSWSLPAVAKIWAWQCQGTYGVTSGTTPAFVLGMNASQAPTSETGSGVVASVSAGATIVEANNSTTQTTSGDQTIVTGATVTTITNGLWSSFGTIQASASAGTFAIRGTITGTTAVGTVNVGSTCMLY